MVGFPNFAFALPGIASTFTPALLENASIDKTTTSLVPEIRLAAFQWRSGLLMQKHIRF